MTTASTQPTGFSRPRSSPRRTAPIPTSTPTCSRGPAADAREDATWSAKRDPSTGYGVAVFDVDPGDRHDDHTSITVRYFHAPGADPVNPTTGEPGAPTPDYSEFETFKLIRPRSDRRHDRR